MLNENREKRALYLLNHIEGMHQGLLKKMYEFAGSFEEAYRMPTEEYIRSGILRDRGKSRELLLHYDRRRDQEERILREYEGLWTTGTRVVTVLDPDYPGRLLPLEDRPYVLYVRGKLPSEEKRTAAIIGARMCTEYGRQMAARFGRALALSGVQVISGMAAGIDGEAQEAALAAGKESFAVLGCGVDVCYPRENRHIFRQMAAGQGGLLSEFPPGSAPLPYRFILRNRIIAGLCDVLLVLEAREHSGTAITVSNALDQGKEIFALPGRIDDPLGKGCNALLKDGASVLTDPVDVLDSLGILEREGLSEEPKNISALAKPEKIVYSCLDSSEQHMDAISERTGIGVPELSAILLRLELQGFAASPMNGYYRKR